MRGQGEGDVGSREWGESPTGLMAAFALGGDRGGKAHTQTWLLIVRPRALYVRVRS